MNSPQQTSGMNTLPKTLNVLSIPDSSTQQSKKYSQTRKIFSEIVDNKFIPDVSPKKELGR